MGTPQDRWLQALGVSAASFEKAAGSVSEVKFHIGPVTIAKQDLGYLDAQGSVDYSGTYEPEKGEDPGVALKFSNGQPEIEAALEKKLASGIKLGGGGSLSATEGSLGLGLKLPDSDAARKHEFKFKIVKVDAKKADLDFAVLEWEETVPLVSGSVPFQGIKINYAGSIVIKIEVSPNKEKIALELAKRFGISIGEDAAASVAAGGTGTAGSIATAAAASPLVIVTSAIVGGLAVTAGVCAGIGKLEDLGADATAVCQDGERQLREYASSYGSAMRGKPGGNAQGNKDAEADLQAMIKQQPGTTHDQAVDAATKSGKKFEDIAYRRVLPKMREQVRAAYKAKEGAVGWFFASDQLERCIMEFLGENNHY
jgi:hypothetical protein